MEVWRCEVGRFGGDLRLMRRDGSTVRLCCGVIWLLVKVPPVEDRLVLVGFDGRSGDCGSLSGIGGLE